MPSHVFVPTQLGESSIPTATFAHVPMLPAMLHALQVSGHAVLQQTPSTQKLLKQSLAAAQVWAFSFLQAPFPSHELVPMQPGESSELAETFEHVPTLPMTLHD
jgi:hypothetical protein